MPRYHFNIEGDRRSGLEAIELEDLEMAKCEAVKLAGHVICEAAGGFWDRAEWNMTVTDERGLTLFTLHFMGMEAPAARVAILPRPTAG